jgi:predicted ATPase/predicted Ser/Thr protein kinase
MINRLLNDRYRVESELGHGGMGVVYRAYDTLLNRSVAIKVLDAAGLGTTCRARFLAEARAAAGLNHPNIVSVYDVGEVDGLPFIVMELVEGQTLRAQPPESLEATLRFAFQICAALDHAHSCGIVHRDLKPENVLVAKTQTAKLMDFGLARSADMPHLTEDGAIVGTFAYMAPELIQGQPASVQSDLYALGVMLYELAAGRPPFDGDTPTVLLSQHLYAAVVPPSTYQAEIPAWLDDLILRLLSKQPDERPASAAEVLRALEQSSTPAAIPLFASPSRPTNNLPAQLDTFIGREKELARVQECLATHRLVTLTGSGGIGKTRMAIQTARALLAEYAQGVWLVDLALVADPRLVPQAVAAVWDVREEQGRPLQAALADYLREKTLLLVLDNCEHVIDASTQLAGYLLHRCPGMRILATSREALGIEGELVIYVPSLSLPPTGPASRETLEGSEAVRLFVSRAAAALPGFELTDANAAAVAQVCRRLDGVALALELAAARVRTLRVEQVAARLNDAFHLLTGGSRTALPRQQTLRATMDWSHALLSDAERACFRRLAVFAGGWTLEAAEAVCTGDGVETSDVLDLLAQLGNKSLVVIDREPGQEARYRLLETIRQYAWEKLQAAGEEEQSRTRHLGYYLKLAQEAEPKLYGAQQLEGLAQLDAEQSNVQAALEWGLENGLETAAQLAGAMFWYWHLRGIWPDGYAWLQRALAVASGGSKRLRALLLSSAGHLAWASRDAHRGVAYCQESIALYRELGDQEGMAFPLATLADPGFGQADAERGIALYQESLDLYRQAGNKWGSRHVLGLLGLTYAYAMEQFEQANACFQESLALARELGVPDGIAFALYCLGILAFFRGDHEQAEALFTEGLPLSHAVGQRYLMVEPLFYLEMIALRKGEFEQAKALAREALAEEIRGTGLRASWRFSLLDADTPWRSEALLSENLALARQSGDRLVTAHGLFRLAGSAWSLGQLERAVRLYAAALAASGFAPSMPLERTDFDHTLTGTLIQLDETTFKKAWAEGSAMTVEQAVAYALEGRL